MTPGEAESCYHYRIMFLDFETASTTDLARCGAWAYMDDPFFDVICAGAAGLTGPVETWQYDDGTGVKSWLEARKPQLLVAHNLEFELKVLQKIGLGHWAQDCQLMDTACLSRRADTGSSLADSCKIWKTAEKSDAGKDLIKNYLCDFKPVPEDRLKEIVEYCAQDVRCLRELYSRLPQKGFFDSRDFLIHRGINERGFLADISTAEFLDDESTRALEHMTAAWTARALKYTQEGKGNPRSIKCRQALSLALGGTGRESWAKGTTDFDDAPAELKAFAEDFQDLAGAAFKKLGALRDQVSNDGRLRGAFIYQGQRTGRFASRGVQIHNLPRADYGYDEIQKFLLTRQTTLTGRSYLDLLRSAIRGVFIAPAGKKLVVGDFSQIELRLQALVTGEKWMLNAFAAGEDIYKQAAAKIFGITPAQVSPEQRSIGKVSTLALGYGAGARGLASGGFPAPAEMEQLRRTSAGWMTQDGIDIPGGFILAEEGWISAEEKLQLVVQQWRGARTKTTRAWRDLDNAAKRVLHAHTREAVPLSEYCTATLSMKPGTGAGDLLLMEVDIAGEQVRLIWPGVQIERENHPSDGYEREKITYRSGMKKCMLWGGIIFENICQSLAAHCLHLTLRACDAMGLEVVAHVHDEIIVECDGARAETVKAQLSHAMSLPQFNGLLASDIWIGDRYGKN